MSRKALWALTGLLCVSLAITGCGKDESTATSDSGSAAPGGEAQRGGFGGATAAKADTPKQAIANLVKALETGDTDLFLRTVHVAEADREVAEVTFQGMCAQIEFDRAMDKAYGKGSGMGMADDLPTAEEIEKAEVTIDGDTAVAKMPDELDAEGMRLIRKDGAWMADLSAEMPEGEAREATLKSGREQVAKMRGVISKIGQEGVTKEQIYAELWGMDPGAMSGEGMEDFMAPPDEASTDEPQE